MAVQHDFPHASFIGRTEELAHIAHLLAESDCRLLTLAGPGGIGKTRLALEVMGQARNQFANGVYFVNFQPVSSADFLISTIADVINMPLSGQEDPFVHLLNYVNNKQMLLVLDNFEHLVEGANLLSELLQAVPGIKLLVTSREVLNLQEEWVYPVQGMSYPSSVDDADLENYGAVQFFMERVRRVRQGFSLAQEKAGVVRICQLLEGMPLALVLASSWTKALPCAEIAAEIQQNLGFLTTTVRNVPERHRSMVAVFEQSWQRLTAEEREVFSVFSVFRGGFRYEAAKAVAGASLHTLSALVDKSLLVVDERGRYQLHELLRQYGEAQLEATPQRAIEVRDLHCAYFIGFIEAQNDIHGGDQIRAVTNLEADLENIRRAWQWAVEQANMEAIQKTAATMMMFYQYKSRYLEGAEAMEKAAQSLDRKESTKQQRYTMALVLVTLGWFRVRLGQVETAREILEQSHTLFETTNTPPPAVTAMEPLAALSIVHVVLGNYVQATRIGEQALEACKERSDQGNLISCLLALASATLAQGDYHAARRYAQQGCAIAQETGHRWILAYCQNQLGSAYQALGEYALAKQQYQASYALREEFNDPEGMAVALNHLGKIAFMHGDYQEAQRLYERSLVFYRDLGDRGGLANALLGLGMAACVLGDDPIARKHLHAALRTALAAGLIPLSLSIIVSIGELYSRMQQGQRAVELLVLALHHPACDHETRERAQQLLADSRVSPSEQHHTVEHFNNVTAALLDELSRPEGTESRDYLLDQSSLIEPLSKRELEVLQLIAEGYSNREIADRLVISVATVKWYGTQIYGKLGVQSRTQAILRARQLNLLP